MTVGLYVGIDRVKSTVVCVHNAVAALFRSMVFYIILVVSIAVQDPRSFKLDAAAVIPTGTQE